jgi:anti-anti-sigma factor
MGCLPYQSTPNNAGESSYPAWAPSRNVWNWKKESELKLDLEFCETPDVVVIACKGRIVYRNEAMAFSAAVAGLLPQRRRIVVDLSGVEAMDGAGLGKLVSLLHHAQQHSCRLELASPSTRVRELLELTGIASAFEVHNKVPALLARNQSA